MPRRVDATEHLLDEVRRRIPVQFKVLTGRSLPSVGEQDVAFWKDVSDPNKPVGKIVIRIGHDRFVFSSAKETVAVGSGQVLVTEDETTADYLDNQLTVSAPLQKSVTGSGDETLNISLDQSGIDHGSIGGLSDDDHAQYFLLAGRSGGQTAYGGSADSENLTLQSTSGSTKGTLWLEPNTAGRLVVGNQEYDPYVSSNKYSGRFFMWAEEGEGANAAISTLHVGQKTTSTAGYPYALSVAQRIFTDARGSALFTNAQFQSSSSTSLARALYAYVSVAGSNSPSVTEAIGITARVEASNSANYATGHGVQSLAASYGSAKIQTFNCFEATVASDTRSAGFNDIRGLHVGDIGATAYNSCDAILVDEQDDGFDGLSGNIRMAGGDWNTGHFQLGQAHIWATAGDLRFSRSEPYSASDYDFGILSSTIDFKTRRGANLSDPVDAQDAVTKAYLEANTTTDHGSLSGLGDDDHTQYLLLAGRSGGQTAHGGSGSGEDLVLRSTSDATLGHVHVADRGAEYATVGTKDTESVKGKLHVGASQADGWRYGLKVEFAGDAASAAFPDALKADITLAGSSAQDGRGHTGVAGFTTLANDFSEPNSEARGMVAAVTYDDTAANSATLGLAIGLRAGIDVGNSNTYNSAHGIESKLNASDSGTIGSWVGVRVFSPTVGSSATVSSAVGVQVDDLADTSSGGSAADGDALLIASQGFSSASKGNLRLAGGDWNTGHIQLGAGHVWATAGEIRFSTTAPVSSGDYDLSIGTSIDVASRRIVNLSDPTNAQDAATKAYVDAHAGGGGLSDAYAAMTDGSNTASASGSDTFKLRSANDRLTITVTDNDATHGDNALFTLDETKIVHQNLSGAGSNDHAAIDSHIAASSGVHGVSGDVVGTTDTQTLTNKTLTSPTITDASISGSTSLSDTMTLAASATVDASDSSAVVKLPDITSSSSYNTGGDSSITARIGQTGTRVWTNDRVIDMGSVVYAAYRSLTVSVLDPQAGDSITLLHTPDRIYVRAVYAAVRGSSSPSVSFNVYRSTDRADSSPSGFWASNRTVSSSTAQKQTGMVNNDNVPRNSFIWVDIDSVSGTVDEFIISVFFTLKVAQSSEGD